MNYLLNFILYVVGVTSLSAANVNGVDTMFKEGSISGEIRTIYADAPEVGGAYSTAIGGVLKYELAQYNGLSAGVAFYTSHDIPTLSGEGSKESGELSSLKGSLTELSEVYINYNYDKLNIRAGRQLLDTPLADSDDIRMIKNTFEAYLLTYDYEGFLFMVGNLQSWHGYDAGLDDGWSSTGDKGTCFSGLSYAEGLVVDLYYYNISGLSNALYFDLGAEYKIYDNFTVSAMLQYLNENELDMSGVSADIYGAYGEVIFHDIGLSIALNQSKEHKNKESFSGFGGGALFTSMDTMILDEITKDRAAMAVVVTLSYVYDEIELFYVYGDFFGKADSNGDKAHIVEQNIGCGYSFNDTLSTSIVYAVQKDKYNTTNDWDRVQASINYTF